MGRACFVPDPAAVLQQLGKKTSRPFEAFGSQFWVEVDGDKVWHHQAQFDSAPVVLGASLWGLAASPLGQGPFLSTLRPLPAKTFDEAGKPLFDRKMSVDVAIGSGARGHSFLTNKDGYLYQTPISWYSQKGIWDLSPGFAPGAISGRPITAECLFCHANHTEPVEGYQNRYQEPVVTGAIGCERCHGPGELHAKTRSATELLTPIDYTIVNPKHLEPRLREAVCQQCHLEGEARILPRGRHLFNFRPGLPLESCLSIFVHKAEDGMDGRAVNHVEQMYSSRCFKASAGKDQLGCISCHDAHAPPSERIAYFRQACLKCHRHEGEAGTAPGGKAAYAPACSQPLEIRRVNNKEDSCIDCHMQRFKPRDIVHVAQTDHRILRHAEGAATVGHGDRRALPLVSFHRGAVDPSDKELTRDLALALLRVSMSGEGDPRWLQTQALGFFQKLMPYFPDDIELWSATARILELQGQGQPALAAWKTILSKQAHNEDALVGAARLSRSVGELNAAVEYWQSAVKASPWRAVYRANLVSALADAGNWQEALEHSRVWLELDPASAEARRYRITCLLRVGQEQQARAQFSALLVLVPGETDRLDAWFAQQVAEASKKE
jgi:hypothetical protein